MTTRIMVVTNAQTSIQNSIKMLGHLGYQVAGHNLLGEQTAEMVKKIAPDLVLLDLDNLHHEMWKTDEAAFFSSAFDIPVICVLNAAQSIDSKPESMAGFVSILVKPVNEHQLRASIELALSRHASEQKLREINERFTLVEQATHDGIWDWDLETGKLYYSPRWLEQLGLGKNENGNSADVWLARLHIDDQQQFQKDLVTHIKSSELFFERDYRIQHKDGRILWMLVRAVTVRDSLGVATRMTGSQTDITARTLVEARQIYDALHDPLTGLPNRVLFMDRLGFRLEHAKRYTEAPFAVLYIDLDRFKVVNDTLGHAAGDQLLVTTAVRIQQCLRPEDTVSRLSGDEFAILVNEIHDVSDAVRIADRIRGRLVTTTLLGSVERSPTASIGIVLCGKNYDHPENILRDADLAMYRAKTMGRNRYQIFDEAMFTGAMAQLQMEMELKRAVTRNEWQVLYQPIVALESNATIGVEALLRWLHPQRGVVYPLEFIRLAEETGYIVPIGLYVLRSACRQVKAWRDAGQKNLWVAVNISGRQFQDENLVEMIKDVLAETKLSPDGLRLEVTESVAMQDIEYTIRVLNELDKLGVYASLDDFGTGYSSLSYLKRFPLKVLKIDQSFIQDIRVNQNSEAITEAIIMMAHSLNLEVIAEGVEKEDQLAFLRTLVCANVQGFYLSYPLTDIELTKIFNDSQSLSSLSL